ncbi:MAG: molybdopterin-binding protein [Desulfobacterales bacterium]|nr:molybdopterin-binding protein [Desulfobacterales bacterium]
MGEVAAGCRRGRPGGPHRHRRHAAARRRRRGHAGARRCRWMTAAIEVFRSVAPGQNLIAAGEDFESGARDRRCRAPRCASGRGRAGGLRPHAGAGLPPTGGRDHLHRRRNRPRRRYPRAGPDPGRQPLHPGRPGRSKSGAVPVAFGIVARRFRRRCTRPARRALERCDMLLISGGSSVGARDYTRRGHLPPSPARSILVHGIAISPGKPTILARVLGKPLWGLPGHVVSAMVVFARIVRPFLLHIAGGCGLRPRRTSASPPASAATSPRPRGARTSSASGSCAARTSGRAEPVLGKSGLLNTMVESDGVIEIGKNVEGLDRGRST